MVLSLLWSCTAAVPGTRQLTIFNTGCASDGTSYLTTLQWNDNDTGGRGVAGPLSLVGPH